MVGICPFKKKTIIITCPGDLGRAQELPPTLFPKAQLNLRVLSAVKEQNLILGLTAAAAVLLFPVRCLTSISERQKESHTQKNK